MFHNRAEQSILVREEGICTFSAITDPLLFDGLASKFNTERHQLMALA
jgi:hypothetical protein